jgi:hypothetical protein
MTEPSTKAASDAAIEATPALEPSEAEIEEWAARERRRREAWLKGPTDEERRAYAHGLRQRRLAEAFDEGEQRLGDVARTGVRMGRETQLAAEGAMRLFYRWSRRTFAELVEAGREWEEETSLPVRRRRVPLDDEAS